MQRNTEYSLDIDSIKEIPFEKYSKDFVFVVNGKEYSTSRVIADILSPKIRQFHYTDETIDHFYIDTIDKYGNFDFSHVLSLTSFQTKAINQEEIEYYIDIFTALGNKKEFFKLIPDYPKEITVKNVIKRIQKKRKIFESFYSKSEKQNNNEFFEKGYFQPELDFISLHFFEINISELQNLDLDLIEEIIKNDQLQLEDEDSLLNLINKLYSKNSKFSHLYEYIDFSNLSLNELCHFFDIFNLNDINGHIWKSVISLIKTHQPNKNETKSINRANIKSTNESEKFFSEECAKVSILVKNEQHKANEIIVKQSKSEININNEQQKRNESISMTKDEHQDESTTIICNEKANSSSEVHKNNANSEITEVDSFKIHSETAKNKSDVKSQHQINKNNSEQETHNNSNKNDATGDVKSQHQISKNNNGQETHNNSNNNNKCDATGEMNSLKIHSETTNNKSDVKSQHQTSKNDGEQETHNNNNKYDATSEVNFSEIHSETINNKSDVKSQHQINNENSEQQQNNVFLLLHKENDEFNGIIRFLTTQTGGNIHDNGTIEVTSNSYFSPPKYLLDFDCSAYFQAGKTDSWVLFDFKSMKVQIDSYSIMSNSGGENLYHLRSWDVEVSNDAENWMIIDERRNHPKLNGSYAVGTFDVRQNEFARYVRLHQTDEPWGGGFLWFYYIEFYGCLKKE